jgi:ubiquinone/menaquinone biosynthesis C-methylase UbiE
MVDNKHTWESKKIVYFYENREDQYLYHPEEVILQGIRYLKRKKLLDIGIGTGRTTLILHNKVAYYYGIDYSLNMIEACRKRFKTNKNLLLEHGDATDLSRFMDESFDIVFFSYNGIDYMNDLNGRQASLIGMYRILKPGGYLIFSSHNYYYISEYYKFPRFRLKLAFLKKMLKFFLIPLYNGVYQRYQHTDYTLFNDGALRFNLTTFYIKPEFQIDLLKNVGFVDIAVFNLNGEEVWENYHQTNNDYFLYYRCIKTN